MKTKAPALLPVLRSDAVGELLARLYLVPDTAWTVTTLAAATGLSLSTTTREITRLVEAGLLTEERVGRTRQVRANSASRLDSVLRDLITLTYGPVPVLEAELAEVGGVRKAYVYGSWAARHEGVRGAEPNDVDVLVIGDADPDVLFDAADAARRRLGLPVDIRRLSPHAWADPASSDPFLSHVRSGPMVELDVKARA